MRAFRISLVVSVETPLRLLQTGPNGGGTSRRVRNLALYFTPTVGEATTGDKTFIILEVTDAVLILGSVALKIWQHTTTFV